MWYIHQVLDNGESESSALEEAKKAGLRSETLEGRAKDYVAQNKPEFILYSSGHFNPSLFTRFVPPE